MFSGVLISIKESGILKDIQTSGTSLSFLQLVSNKIIMHEIISPFIIIVYNIEVIVVLH
jgi:hypothetical protein